MRLRAHHVLFAGFAAVVTLLVILVVGVAEQRLRRELVAHYRLELERDLALAEEVLRHAPESDFDTLAGMLTGRIGFRVTLIALDGRVLGDSDVPAEQLPHLEDYRDRPEVQEALRGRTGFAERFSTTAGFPALYGARAVTLNGETVVLRLAAPVREIDRMVGGARRAVIVAGLLALALALPVSYLLSRVMMRPVVKLGERARALAHGDFSRRAPMDVEVAELDELAVAFNLLAESLEARLVELARERDETRALIDSMAEGVIALSADGRVVRASRAAARLLRLPADAEGSPVGALVRQPELRVAFEEALVSGFDAREASFDGRTLLVTGRPLDQGGAVVTLLDATELRKLERVRRDFVANASHELKTPLTAMRGYAETLLEEEPPPELRRQFLEALHGNAVRLQRLVDDMLELSTLDAGAWRPRLEAVDVAAAAREVWREFEPRARDKPIAFRVSGRARAHADAAAVEHIFRNLFDNAYRHTPAGGEISVTVTESDGKVQVAVSDTGSGIPSAALPRIFERFYRVDPARSRAEGGTGLGLAIVRHLLEGMSGAIAAESELGKGTTIRFSLPVAEEARTREAE